MAQPSPQIISIEPKWSVSLNPTVFNNSSARSGRAGRLVVGTCSHPYKSPSQQSASPEPREFGTYCFDSDSNQLWADKFEGYEGIYCVAISDDASIAAS